MLDVGVYVSVKIENLESNCGFRDIIYFIYDIIVYYIHIQVEDVRY